VVSQCEDLDEYGDGVSYENGQIVMPDYLGLAYFYVSVDSGPWERVPADPETYLPPGRRSYNLREYVIDSRILVDEYGKPDACFNYKLELWAWQGDQLILLGRDFFAIACAPYLMVCDRNASGPDACQGADSKHLKTSAFLSNDLPILKRQFYYALDAAMSKEANKIVWKVYRYNPDIGPQVDNWHKSKNDKSWWGNFAYDFNLLDDLEGVYYVKMKVYHDDEYLGTSNAVKIEIGDAGEQVRETPAKHAPNIYDIEFSTYQEPDFPTYESWAVWLLPRAIPPITQLGLRSVHLRLPMKTKRFGKISRILEPR
jgi:hypothetical protein